MRFVLLALAISALVGCAEKSGPKSFIGIDGYTSESRRWKQGEEGSPQFGGNSTHRYAATQSGMAYVPRTNAWH